MHLKEDFVQIKKIFLNLKSSKILIFIKCPAFLASGRISLSNAFISFWKILKNIQAVEFRLLAKAQLFLYKFKHYSFIKEKNKASAIYQFIYSSTAMACVHPLSCTTHIKRGFVWEKKYEIFLIFFCCNLINFCFLN